MRRRLRTHGKQHLCHQTKLLPQRRCLMLSCMSVRPASERQLGHFDVHARVHRVSEFSIYILPAEFATACW